MTLCYAPSTGGFYDTDLHSTVPDDAVEITNDLRARLMDAQATGAQIVVSAQTGLPEALHPLDEVEALRAALVRRTKAEAERRILAIAPVWRQVNDLRAPCTDAEARFTAIDAVRAASNAIEAELAAADAEALADWPVTDNPLWPTATAEQEPA
ncbi:hypothetical protein [Novosphingobium clariflavum]|uniref:Tail fiber assembly protein n=1 Tax=Novosphingobium clariflavum TaxID=2029884 RepID=A0ABV6S7Q5_9SPHN|nr:hypothetical protein [Novosphingobium clariflavum]